MTAAHGHVVPAASVECPVHQSAASVGSCVDALKHLSDRVVRDEIGHPISAEQDLIAVHQTQLAAIDLHETIPAAEDVGQHM